MYFDYYRNPTSKNALLSCAERKLETFNIVRDNNTPEVSAFDIPTNSGIFIADSDEPTIRDQRKSSINYDKDAILYLAYFLLANSTLIKNTTNLYNITKILPKEYNNLDNIKRPSLTRIEKSSNTIESVYRRIREVEEEELEKEKATKEKKATKEEKEKKATKEEEEEATKESTIIRYRRRRRSRIERRSLASLIYF
ncbi:uncharacterized protein RAG0_09098 [Rhynchosporium agropyri]|uniref:Uncharacterized protein n=1 Tax=Rhynchosporium agropyri TaxID=914238 RepID=A0A1E1KTT3_9HELO|nr:uncharacterized protein RAG0_09098 [Rhynchosporium agropyri]